MSDKRLAAALAKIDVESDGEALTAARYATKLLKERGLSWTDVAELITKRSLGDMMAPEGNQPQARSGNAFEDIFDKSFDGIFSQMNENFKASRDRQAQARAEAADRRAAQRMNKIIQGTNIPASIYGLVEIMEEQEWKSQTTLLITIKNLEGTIAYGPLKVWDKAIVEKMLLAADKNNPQVVTASVRPAKDARYSPNVTYASVDGPYKG